MKLLTIIIPSYNVDKYIDRCLSTFVIKSYMAEIEVIVVNDGSSDNTAVIAQSYVDKYPQTFKLINKENGGHGSTVNTGIRLANGKYFKVVDGDDWVDQASLINLITILKNTDVDLISTHYEQVNMQTGESTPFEEKNVEYNRAYSFDELNIGDRYFTIHSMCIKTSILKEHNITLQEKTFYVDVEFTIFPIAYTKTVMFLDLYVYKYFVGNPNQSVSNINMVKRYYQHDRVIKRVLEFMRKTEMSNAQLDYCRRIMKMVILTHYTIGWAYHPDRVIGQEMNLEFDKYLKENDPYMYTAIAKEYTKVRILRKYSFDIVKIENMLKYRIARKVRAILCKPEKLMVSFVRFIRKVFRGRSHRQNLINGLF